MISRSEEGHVYPTKDVTPRIVFEWSWRNVDDLLNKPFVYTISNVSTPTLGQRFIAHSTCTS